MAQIKVVIANRIVEGHPLGDRTVLGRSRSAGVILSDKSVSREHAAISADGPRWWIEDLGSTAGVRVNGVKVERERLHEGDVVSLGDQVCIFTLEQTPPEPERAVTLESPAECLPDADWTGARDLEADMAGSRTMVDAAGELLPGLLSATALSEQEQLRFSMAAQEALGNAYRHGNAKDEGKRIHWRLIRDENKVVLRVRDEGGGFDYVNALSTARDGDPLEVARARYQQGAPGGLGIMMMVRGCDMVEFAHGGAEVILTKCPADLFVAQTIYGGLEFQDGGPSMEDIAAERRRQTGEQPRPAS